MEDGGGVVPAECAEEEEAMARSFLVHLLEFASPVKSHQYRLRLDQQEGGEAWGLKTGSLLAICRQHP